MIWRLCTKNNSKQDWNLFMIALYIVVRHEKRKGWFYFTPEINTNRKSKEQMMPTYTYASLPMEVVKFVVKRWRFFSESQVVDPSREKELQGSISLLRYKNCKAIW